MIDYSTVVTVLVVNHRSSMLFFLLLLPSIISSKCKALLSCYLLFIYEENTVQYSEIKVRKIERCGPFCKYIGGFGPLL